MTEALEKWVNEQQKKTPYHYCGATDAEFWLRAFCDEVENRAKLSDAPYYGSLWNAFEVMKHELLGGRDAK